MPRIFYNIFIIVMLVIALAGVASADETDPTVPYRAQEGEAKGKFGYQDKNTKSVVIPPVFDAALMFYNDLAPVAIRNKKTDKLEWGYIDHAGTFVIKPQYTKAYYFSSPSIAIVEITKGKFAIINRQGDIVLNVDQTTSNKFFPVWNGLIAVQVNGLWGYVNTSGELVILPQYASAQDFESDSGLARVYRDNTKNPMYIDSSNNVVIDEAELNYMGNGLIRGRVNTKWGIFSSNGQVMISPVFDEVGDYSAEGVPVRIGAKWGYVRGGGAGYIISNLGLMNNSKSREQIRQEYVEKASTIMIKPQFNQARPFGFVSREAPNPKALGAVKIGNQWGYVNKEGQVVIHPQFDDASDFLQFNSNCKSFCTDQKKCTMAVILKNNEKGCVELNGKFHLASEIKPVEQSAAITPVASASVETSVVVNPAPVSAAAIAPVFPVVFIPDQIVLNPVDPLVIAPVFPVVFIPEQVVLNPVDPLAIAPVSPVVFIPEQIVLNPVDPLAIAPVSPVVFIPEQIVLNPVDPLAIAPVSSVVFIPEQIVTHPVDPLAIAPVSPVVFIPEQIVTNPVDPLALAPVFPVVFIPEQIVLNPVDPLAVTLVSPVVAVVSVSKHASVSTVPQITLKSASATSESVSSASDAVDAAVIAMENEVGQTQAKAASMYRVLVGKFNSPKDTESLLRKLKKTYTTAFVRKGDDGYSIQIEAGDEQSSKETESKLKEKGYDAFIVEVKK